MRLFAQAEAVGTRLSESAPAGRDVVDAGGRFAERRLAPVAEAARVASAWTEDLPANVRALPARDADVCVVGLGYVGLPTAVGLADAGLAVIGVDVSERRIDDVRARRVDLLADDLDRLADALESPSFELTTAAAAIARARTVLICVPTPVDRDKRPELSFVRAACESVVEHARPGQTIILTSTSYVGTTREMLVDPLVAEGFAVGDDIHVAFAPERIDPGNHDHAQTTTPRVIGGVTPACAEKAATVLTGISGGVHIVSSPEAAELTKLHENTFRAVNIALANELADISSAYGIDAMEVIGAAATKPYGFMPFFPGAGVGGHCIPCDPHYLLAPLTSFGVEAPLIERAMRSIELRPRQVVDRAAQALAVFAKSLAGARVLVVGAAYKPGVQDVRESPALEIMRHLRERGAEVAFTDPLVKVLELADDEPLFSCAPDEAGDYDLTIVVTRQPGETYAAIADCPLVLDCTNGGGFGDLMEVS